MFETVPPLVNAPPCGREPDELGHPADRLILDLRGGRRPDREVGVEARGEEVAEHADLEARRADEGEVARARLGDRLVERPARILEHLERAASAPRAAPLRAAP